MCGPSWPSNTIVGTITRIPCTAIRTCYVPRIWAIHVDRVIPFSYPPAIVATISMEHSSSRSSACTRSRSLQWNRGPLFKKRSIWTFVNKLMKGLLQLIAFGIGMTILLMELIVLPCIVWFCCRGHGLGISQHWCPFTSISMLVGFAVKWESLISSLGLLFPGPTFLSAWVLALFEASVFSVQIVVARMNSATFLKALANEVSFCVARENFNRSLFSSFRKEVYATPSSRSQIKTVS